MLGLQIDSETGEITLVSKVRELDMQVQDNFFKDYPAYCYEYIEGNLNLKVDADDLVQAKKDIVEAEAFQAYAINLSEAISKAVQVLLNSQAQFLRWDDIKSARAACGVPLDGEETEYEMMIYNQALSLAIWDRKVWGKINEIEARQDPLTTVDSVLSELPEYIGV